ncbi:MAG: CinA family nicotinamide mononucleotide deamidase-related protein [Sediminispirochaetaceae bacterium]
MTAEILSTGDELRTGALIDSNSAWIAEMLEAEGVEVVRHTTVGDDMEQLVQVLIEIAGRSDAAVVTGGLGPTTDDLSREAAAKAAGVELVRNAEALESLEGFFRNRNRAMAPSNLKQALLPESAVCIPNHRGSAPGFHMRIGGSLIFFLPGVPSEMKPMLVDSVLPEFRRAAGTGSRFSCIRTFRSFGLNESSAGEKLEGFDQAFPGLKLGYRGFFPEIQIKIYASGPDEAMLQREVESASAWIRERIGHKIFSENGDSMAEVAAALLRREGATMAAAEQCTGGLLAHTLTEVPGSGDFFAGSVVSYSAAALQERLEMSGLHSEIGSEDEAERIAGEMAAAVQRLTGAAFGLVTVEIESGAGIGGANKAADSGTAGSTAAATSAGPSEAVLCVGLAAPRDVKARTYRLPLYNPAVKKPLFVMAALNYLRKELLSGE